MKTVNVRVVSAATTVPVTVINERPTARDVKAMLSQQDNTYAGVVHREIMVHATTANNQSFFVLIPRSSTVAQLKEAIHALSEIPVDGPITIVGKAYTDPVELNQIWDIEILTVLVNLKQPQQQEQAAPTHVAGTTSPSKEAYILGAGAIGAIIGAVTSTTVAAALDYFKHGTAEQLGMTFGISIPAGLISGLIIGYILFNKADKQYHASLMN